jgi:hypothetical protein
MRCFNCGKEIPEKAKICEHCEAPVEEEVTAEDAELVQEMLEGLHPEAKDALLHAFEQSSTAEEFVNRIMVGACPKCGSEDTGDCDHDPEIDNILVGRCFACGQLWCTECGKLLSKDRPDCECWDEEQ